MIREIVQAGHPALRRPADLVELSQIGTPEFDQLIADMVETMHAAPGVGLAAPQIGISLQLVVLEDRSEVVENLEADDVERRERQVVPLHVLINPTIEPVGRKQVEFYEGCLSVAGWAAITPRYHRVRVKALDQQGEPIELDWQGWPARILQHEIDHLRATLYIDHMDTTTFATTENLERWDDEEDDDEDEE